MGGFLKANHFDEIISEKDYPSKEVLSTLGVPDHFMFEYALKEISKKQSSKTPFFAAFMTGSDHGPYIIPKNISFKPKTSDTKTAIVEYTDWSIGHLIELAKKEPWFSNTIFVFIADHGFSGSSSYEISLDYHHSPFIIYSPKYIPVGKEFNQIGLQIDVSPTVLSFMHLNYLNNTMGIDLLKDKREFATFSSDDKIGCLNDSLYAIIRTDGTMTMFLYKAKNTENVFDKYPELAKKMKNFSYSFLQASQWLIKNKFASQAVLKK
jgi:phosphoglycerol transferase MdoB-like AlkP superfamily enzyme